MAEKITDTLVKSLEAPTKGNRITYDTQIKGFGVRVTSGGSKSFIVNYRVGARERRYTIGQYNEWSVEAARKRAKDLKKMISRGEDPMGERHAVRGAPTVKELAERYLKDYAAEKRSVQADIYIINQHVIPKLGTLKVAEVSYTDLDKLRRRLKETPVRANRTLALLSKMFSLSIRWGMRSDNPAKGVERYHEGRRERFLSEKELARLLEVLADQPDQQSANAIRLLILTGARRGEVLSANWDEFDLEAGTWTKPSAHTKQKKEHRIPISPPAVQLLAGMKEESESDLVFPGRVPGEPLKEIKKFWARVRKIAGIEDVRMHDLRHSYASILASSGISLPMIGALLGHTQPSTTARYAHLLDGPLREATEKVADAITAAQSGKSAEIIPMRRK